jgi:hypothetical protein
MNGGRIAGELPIEQCSEAALGRLMGGAAPVGAPQGVPERVPHRAERRAAP